MVHSIEITSWAQRLGSSSNFLTQTNKNVTMDQGGFLDAKGTKMDLDTDNIYEGTWDLG